MMGLIEYKDARSTASRESEAVGWLNNLLFKVYRGFDGSNARRVRIDDLE